MTSERVKAALEQHRKSSATAPLTISITIPRHHIRIVRAILAGYEDEIILRKFKCSVTELAAARAPLDKLELQLSTAQSTEIVPSNKA